MKYTAFIASQILFFSLHASQEITDTNQTITQPITPKPYSLIQPVSIEKAPEIILEIIDTDKDGVSDDIDECPNSQEGEKVDRVGCLIKFDLDRDGITDDKDKCPNSLKGISVDKDGCELDSDNDGVVDSQDECPGTGVDFSVDGYGCPQTATLRLNFATGKYDITEEIIGQLEEFAQFLKDNKGYQIIIYGYTDYIGTEESNKRLSQNRANSVMKTLMRYGIKSSRMTAIGKSESSPLADNETEEGRAENRRIEVELIK